MTDRGGPVPLKVTIAEALQTILERAQEQAKKEERQRAAEQEAARGKRKV